MNDFIKGDTSLIKDLTDEINRLRQDNNRLLDELNITKLTLAEKEQERLDTLNDNKYYKNLCSELTQQLTEKNEEIEKLKDVRIYNPTMEILTNALAKQNQTAIKELEKVKAKVRDVSGALALCEVEVQIDQQIKRLKESKK